VCFRTYRAKGVDSGAVSGARSSESPLREMEDRGRSGKQPTRWDTVASHVSGRHTIWKVPPGDICLSSTPGMATDLGSRTDVIGGVGGR
jgi:hypothetical protein